MWLDAVSRRIAQAVVLPLTVLMMCAAPVAAAPVPLSSVIGSPVEGTYKTLNGTEITVAPCPDGFCGTLSWIVIPKKNAADCRAADHQQFATLMLDYSNPDKALQTRPLLGLVMLTAQPTNDPNNFTAKVYNPQDGSTNDVLLFSLDGGNTLRIGGACVGTMCAVTQDWPKIPTRPDAPNFTCEGGE